MTVQGNKPHDGYYGGNVALMCINGTYPQFREEVQKTWETMKGSVLSLDNKTNHIVNDSFVNERMKEYDKLWDSYKPVEKKKEKKIKKSSKKPKKRSKS